eukprot:6213851-Pleurochrysis_carterae.AAC.2
MLMRCGPATCLPVTTSALAEAAERRSMSVTAMVVKPATAGAPRRSFPVGESVSRRAPTPAAYYHRPQLDCAWSESGFVRFGATDYDAISPRAVKAAQSSTKLGNCTLLAGAARPARLPALLALSHHFRPSNATQARTMSGTRLAIFHLLCKLASSGDACKDGDGTGCDKTVLIFSLASLKGAHSPL